MIETICQKTRVDNNFLNFIKGPYEKAVGNIMFFGQGLFSTLKLGEILYIGCYHLYNMPYKVNL